MPYHGIKKNRREIFFNRKTRRPFIGKSAKLADYEKILNHHFSAVYKNVFNGSMPLDMPLSVKMIFYFNNYYTAKKVVSKKLPDLSNLYQCVEDCLQSSGVILNDSLIESHDGSRRKPSPDGQNYLYVEVSRHEV